MGFDPNSSRDVRAGDTHDSNIDRPSKIASWGSSGSRSSSVSSLSFEGSADGIVDATIITRNGLGGMARTKSLHSLCYSSDNTTTCVMSSLSPTTTAQSKEFVHNRLDQIQVGSQEYESVLRKMMEPRLRKARILRTRFRDPSSFGAANPIASSLGVPYTALRKERPFLFDEQTHPLGEILADTLGVDDLSRIHEMNVDDATLRSSLLNPGRRAAFHKAYDCFVTTFCLPLLHSLAISKQVFHVKSSSARITYRYQAFPTIDIVRPGASATLPVCDTATGHSIGCLAFHIPLTASFGTNALYTESYPGREDWHPLTTKSGGLGFLFDGSRCLHFSVENTSNVSRVSLYFRVMIYRERSWYDDIDNEDDDAGLCSVAQVRDSYTGGTYYDEAVMELGRSAFIKRSERLQDPDKRQGFSFV